MTRLNCVSVKSFTFASFMLILGCTMPVRSSLQSPQRVDAVSPRQIGYLNRGRVEDWTHHHVFFSNPGTMEDAIRNGAYEKWRRIVNDPRYQMQMMRRHGALAGLTADSAAVLQAPPKVELPVGIFNKKWKEKEGFRSKSLHADWNHIIAGGHHGVALDMYPAKYTFDPIAPPDCTNDFVVFPIDSNGSPTQADLIGVNNLYNGTCTTGTVPTVLFSYVVGSGDVQTSPVLSLDGTKVAFIESSVGASNFHVLTIDKSGNSGCPNSSPCNGTDFNTPATPGVNNNAVDVKISMSGGVTVTHAAPFVDYANDVAYAADDIGQLHKFTGVFQGIPAEVTTAPWPVTVAIGVTLTGPVYDSVSQNIFVGGSDGNLYCVTAAGAACSTPSISVASGVVSLNGVLDEPLVDSTAQTVFAAANNLTNAVLMQATTSLSSPVRATMGAAGTDLYTGAFDDAYFTDISTGHMYFCGNLTSTATPNLWRVTFNSNGTMSNTNDGSSFEVVRTGAQGKGEDCTPLTEVFNTSQNTDYLFLGVTDNGFSTGTPNCGSATCIMSFVLPTSSPFTFPTAANATTTLNLGNAGNSGIIVDNVTGEAGASQIYFGNLQASSGVQVSQSALQ